MDRDNNGSSIQAMALQQGLINITSADGEKEGINAVHCESDGTISIKWEDDTTTSYSMSAGEDRTAGTAKSVTISSGTFTFAK